MSLKSIQKELKTLNDKFEVSRQAYLKEVSKIKEQYKNLYHACVNCGKKSQLKTIIFVKDYWYDSHIDCYLDSKERMLVCPKCSVMTRYYKKDTLENIVQDESAYLKVIDYKPKNHPYYDMHDIYGKKRAIETLERKNAKNG